jgi:hypothetical protein
VKWRAAQRLSAAVIGGWDLALAAAAASGRYPHLAAALTAGGPPRNQDDIFGSGIEHLIGLAGLQQPR